MRRLVWIHAGRKPIILVLSRHGSNNVKICFDNLIIVLCKAQGKTAGGFSLSGMKKALFGNDTQEQRELKLKHLDEQIKLTEQELAQINEETQ
jgi:hypothetical protein